ncbi:hypothetical protein Ancab_016921, partial [Ancistrocladus abbreviatus]
HPEDKKAYSKFLGGTKGERAHGSPQQSSSNVPDLETIGQPRDTVSKNIQSSVLPK